MPDNQSADHCGSTARVLFGERLRRALRIHVGRGREYSVQELARAANIGDRLIDGWLAGPDSSDWREPKATSMDRLYAVLGADFVNDMLAPAGVAAFTVPDGGDATALRTIAVEAVKDAAELNGILSDGRVDHIERPQARAILARKAERLGTLRKVVG